MYKYIVDQMLPSENLSVHVFLWYFLTSYLFIESRKFDISEFSPDREKTNVFIFHLLPTSSRFVNFI